VKFVKLLTIPAVLLVSLVMAVPAFAHTFDKGKLDSSCDKTTGQICLTLSGTIEPGFDARTVTFQLYGMKGTTETLLAGNTVSFDLPANPQNNAAGKPNSPLDFPAVKKCFTAVTTGNFDSFVVKVTGVTDTKTTKAADIHMDLTVNGAKQTTTVEFPNETAVTVVTGISPCIANTPPPGNGGGTPTPTTSANTTVALAQTGGFDFRFPLIGLVLLVAGGALFVVSASRGRSADTK
jgi:hypothetical protein